MNTKSILPLSLLAGLLLAACIVPPSMFERASWGPPPEYWQGQGRYRPADGPAAGSEAPGPAAERATVATKPAEAPPIELDVEGRPVGNPLEKPESEAPLYAWDGGVVRGAPQGRVTTQEGTPRGVETPPAGRTHIIELYQQVLDERDALAEEVEALRQDLAQTSLALEVKSKESDELSARVASLEASHRELMNDNQSIAGRLVQAQIRRLEAEKLLLETRIESERAKAEETARAAAAQSKATTTRSKPTSRSEDGEHQ